MDISWLTVKQRCDLAIDEAIRRGDSDTAILFLALSKTGLRVGELLDMREWELTQSGKVFVPAHKRGNAKLISQELFRNEIIVTMSEGKVYSFPGSRTTYRNLFIRYSGLDSCYVGRKRILLHAFRHVFIKQKVDEGVSISEISTALGIRRNGTTLGYIYKKYQTDKYNPEFLTL